LLFSSATTTWTNERIFYAHSLNWDNTITTNTSNQVSKAPTGQCYDRILDQNVACNFTTYNQRYPVGIKTWDNKIIIVWYGRSDSESNYGTYSILFDPNATGEKFSSLTKLTNNKFYPSYWKYYLTLKDTGFIHLTFNANSGTSSPAGLYEFYWDIDFKWKIILEPNTKNEMDYQIHKSDLSNIKKTICKTMYGKHIGLMDLCVPANMKINGNFLNPDNNPLDGSVFESEYGDIGTYSNSWDFARPFTNYMYYENNNEYEWNIDKN